MLAACMRPIRPQPSTAIRTIDSSLESFATFVADTLFCQSTFRKQARSRGSGRNQMTRATVRLTMAQALVRYLCNQFTEIDGERGAAVRRASSRSSATATSPASREALGGGEGRAADLARPERAVDGAGRDRLRQGQAAPADHGRGHARSGRAPPTWSPPPAVAHTNRLPVLLLSGDNFANRRPDPVMQQVEHFGNPTITVNDAFKAGHAATGTGSRGPSRSSARCRRRWRRCSTRPIAARPSSALCQDTQEMAFDYPEAFFEPTVHRSRARAPTATGWPRRWRC